MRDLLLRGIVGSVLVLSFPFWVLVALAIWLTNVGKTVDNDDPHRHPCWRCGRMYYLYGPVRICPHCETPEEQIAHLEAMDTARKIQTWKEAKDG